MSAKRKLLQRYQKVLYNTARPATVIPTTTAVSSATAESLALEVGVGDTVDSAPSPVAAAGGGASLAAPVTSVPLAASSLPAPLSSTVPGLRVSGAGAGSGAPAGAPASVQHQHLATKIARQQFTPVGYHAVQPWGQRAQRSAEGNAVQQLLATKQSYRL